MLTKIEWPQSRTFRTGTKDEPIQFYLESLYSSNRFDLLLGYFSSAAISVLSIGFAKFIYSGGTMRIIANHILNEEDKNAIIKSKGFHLSPPLDLSDIKNLRKNLDDYGEHFFKCLAYLLQNRRITIKVVKPNGRKGISHYKSGLFYDDINKISFTASCNFTAYGLLENAETLTCFLESDGPSSQHKIYEDEKEFIDIFNEKVDYLDFLNVNLIETAIKSEFGGQELDELIIEEKKLLQKKRLTLESDYLVDILQKYEEEIERIINKPKFPFKSGALNYQIEAYNNWVKNNYSGLFSMATGTGKTITSLNCALNIYRQTNSYYILILVPSIPLLNQWEAEVLNFNFKNILKIGGGNKWENEFADYCSNFKFGIKPNLCVISVIDSFTADRFQKYYKIIEKEFILIADEAHNLGSKSIQKVLDKINPQKRIGLSATPKRIYDIKGTEFLNNFFKDEEPYCYNFPMSRALTERRLTQYFYYPRIVSLEKIEQEEYNKISKQLLKYFDFENGRFKDMPIVETLLLMRKRIIHKANGKLSEFKRILYELKAKDKLKYVFTYVPEGNEKEDKEERIIYNYIKAAHQFDSSLKLASYTSQDQNHQDILDSFEKGVIDIVFAMKMLDEGVDIPRTEIGIFASSTGNPRQYIQRRGRLLRNHPDKTFSTVYDLIVIPHRNDHADKSLFTIERNLLKNELNRVAYFASLSINQNDTKKELQNICSIYNLDIDVLIQELL